MIKYDDMIITTLVIDLFLVYIYYTNKLNKFDENNILFLFFLHFIFIISLLNKYDLILDISHIIFIVQVYIISLFTSNINMILLYVFIIMVMLCYWYIDNKCPLGRYERITWLNKLLIAYNGIFTSIPYIILIILIYKIYKKSS